MKLSLAFALCHNADLIIMDEPTSGLDPVFRSELLDILYNVIQDANVSIFFSTHITTDLEKIADYITFIDKGKLVFSQTKDEIVENYGLVKGSKELLDNDTRREFVSIKETNFGFEALTKDISKARIIFKGKGMIEKASLEEIMVYTVRGNV
jgi:ABC-2 type transport system ATP-binding protein